MSGNQDSGDNSSSNGTPVSGVGVINFYRTYDDLLRGDVDLFSGLSSDMFETSSESSSDEQLNSAGRIVPQSSSTGFILLELI